MSHPLCQCLLVHLVPLYHRLYRDVSTTRPRRRADYANLHWCTEGFGGAEPQEAKALPDQLGKGCAQC